MTLPSMWLFLITTCLLLCPIVAAHLEWTTRNDDPAANIDFLRIFQRLNLRRITKANRSFVRRHHREADVWGGYFPLSGIEKRKFLELMLTAMVSKSGRRYGYGSRRLSYDRPILRAGR